MVTSRVVKVPLLVAALHMHRYAKIRFVSTRGPVAQLGARFHGMEEVVSSNLTRSTKTRPNKT